MTGPEHYREAERLLEASLKVLAVWGDSRGAESAVAASQRLTARAAIHAQLAQTAATIEVSQGTRAYAWQQVTT